MADRAGGGTSLRGMRERMVAAAQAIAAERRSQSGLQHQASTTTTTSMKSTFKPILDGSVLKNDEKQRLAKERREEKRRRDDANKEIQLLEKERKAKIYHEKQVEEKQRKLKEQKEKDEQRRMSVEEKRKQKLEEDQERYKAVLSRIVERSNSRADSKKRWSWEGPIAEGKPAADIKDGKMGKRSSSLNRKYTDAQLHSDKNQPVGRPPGTHALVPCMARSNRSRSSHELQSVIVIPSMPESGTSELSDQTPISKSTKVLHNKNVRKPPRKSRGQEPAKGRLPPTFKVPASLRMEVASPSQEVKVVTSKMSRASLPAIELGERFNPDGQLTSSADKAVCETNLETCVGVSLESSPGDSLDPSPEVSTESSEALSVNPSPEVSIDSSGEVSLGTSSPDVSVEVSPEASLVEIPLDVKVEVLPEHPMELPRAQYADQMNQLSESATDEITGPSSDMKNARQKTEMSSGHLAKKLTSNNPCYASSSLTGGGSRISKPKCPPSPVMSKSSAQYSLTYKITPVQQMLYMPNSISRHERMRGMTPKPKSQDLDLGNKTTPGVVNKEEATKILSEKRRLIREQREKESQKVAVEDHTQSLAPAPVLNLPSAPVLNLLPSNSRKEKDLEVPGEDVPSQPQTSDDADLQKSDYIPQKQDLAKAGGSSEPDDQKKGDAKTKAQEEADKRKKEHERIMLQNLKERLERKKRIEEIMKRTRRTDWIPSKAAGSLSKAEDADDEDEADDEQESDSETDLSDDRNSSASLSSEETSLKPQIRLRNAKKSTKLIFLDPTSTQLRPGTRVFFDCGAKSAQPMSSKGAGAVTKGARTLSKRATTSRSIKGKSLEANKSLDSSKSLVPPEQEWYCSTVIDMSNDTETLIRRAAHIKKYHPRGSLSVCKNLPNDDKSSSQSDK
ncbi:MAP7 domain-containing protein 3 [Sorex fumeus]|uniref:MAP7 domain-containing protein 3 n=1 Tax=Sorex fumeus TaxID=62283 RepID=UPI0024AE33C3|nr:MAP7 domain-containing protein 3 [Sorex fumeus]